MKTLMTLFTLLVTSTVAFAEPENLASKEMKGVIHSVRPFVDLFNAQAALPKSKLSQYLEKLPPTAPGNELVKSISSEDIIRTHMACYHEGCETTYLILIRESQARWVDTNSYLRAVRYQDKEITRTTSFVIKGPVEVTIKE